MHTAETRFEVIIGALLTQQTTWKNVELAIENPKDACIRISQGKKKLISLC